MFKNGNVYNSLLKLINANEKKKSKGFGMKIWDLAYYWTDVFYSRLSVIDSIHTPIQPLKG